MTVSDVLESQNADARAASNPPRCLEKVQLDPTQLSFVSHYHHLIIASAGLQDLTRTTAFADSQRTVQRLEPGPGKREVRPQAAYLVATAFEQPKTCGAGSILSRSCLISLRLVQLTPTRAKGCDPAAACPPQPSPSTSHQTNAQIPLPDVRHSSAA